MPESLHRRDSTPATAPHVLVVDDDPEIGRLLSRYLGAHGLEVSVAADGTTLRSVMQRTRVDAILLDLGLPDEDGLSLVRDLRSRWQGPLIIVSGRGESVDQVVGLELGADDYVSKPFDMRELLARIRSVLRRVPPQALTVSVPQEGFEFAGLRLELFSRRLIGRDGCDIELTTGEFDLLVALLRRPNHVLSRDQLMTAIHGRQAGPFDRAIDMQVGRLRRKIDTVGQPQIIKSVRGAGYLFAAHAHPF
ncbi:transcriptional regulatory protein AruR [Stenotrophomonas sp. DDT-1]|uniref:response regulator n=1 Tax=Stenotrophomonas sp. DDT-1 TaxID=1609637 RepID=UPI000776F9B7|nr:response regulator transcription factor [Stenotrophomonas sp. DDT-1]KXU98389.1 transcriptional regulatory protein AruR [Stenotrophomonas sp. DDT-1]